MTDTDRGTQRDRHSAFYLFTQQNLPACKPVLTPEWVFMTFLFIGFIFIPVGLVTLRASHSVVEIVERYDIGCVPEPFRINKVSYIQDDSIPKNCSLSFKVILRFYIDYTFTVKIENLAKLYLQPFILCDHNALYCSTDYHELMESVGKEGKLNYYIVFLSVPYTLYVKSRSDKQLLHGQNQHGISSCQPVEVNNDRPIIPCGLIAWSLFNDTFTFIRNRAELKVNRKNIAWKSDREHKFGKNVYPFNFQNGTLIGGGKLNPRIPLSDQEDLIVWMRTSALPSFRKLYGRIEKDLDVDDVVVVHLMNNYNTYSFGGIKKTRVIYHGTEQTIQGDSTDEIPTDILNSKTASDFKP
ncbi:hypothetical protein GOBAR_AA34585 [Gossypium barbadense]|uniref:ALA-interacting subunit n=1 Tax=Gossypium barbadense TaxID=3634 RepID=A0A2P5W4W8_GOSBA|nr:hypothetical protein GOBAR_AA34585 [Gossypium barbadense]